MPSSKTSPSCPGSGVRWPTFSSDSAT
jgi:hypothetical protein